MTKLDEHPWHNPGKWVVQPLNYADHQATPPRDVFVVDSTIRSICTSEPGSLITPGQLIEIIAKLEDTGVKSVMLNIAHMRGHSELAHETAKLAVKQSFTKIKLDTGAASIRPYKTVSEWKDEFHKMADLGVDELSISYGAGSSQDDEFYGTQSVFPVLHEIAQYMHEQGFPPSISYNIKPHTSFPFFMEFVRHAARAKPRYFRIYDTDSSMSPHTIERITRHIRAEYNSKTMPLVLHTHNALGMAVASTCAAAYAGMDGIDVAVQGVGTKSGHTDLAETVVALETLYGIRTGIKLDELTSLCRLVEEHLGIRVHDRKPIDGRHAFLAEQSWRVVSVLQERISGKEHAIPIAPSLVGGQRSIVWGKNTLKPYVIELKLKEMGLSSTENNIRRALDALQAELATRAQYPAWLEDEEATNIIESANLS